MTADTATTATAATSVTTGMIDKTAAGEITTRLAKEVYISVDIESSGPIPGEYSMLSLGACVVGDTTKTFYREFKPITDKYLKEALKVSGISLDELRGSGVEPKHGMLEFENWIKAVSNGKRSVLVAFNATFDWMFVSY